MILNSQSFSLVMEVHLLNCELSNHTMWLKTDPEFFLLFVVVFVEFVGQDGKLMLMTQSLCLCVYT